MHRLFSTALLVFSVAIAGCGELVDPIGPGGGDDDRRLAQGFTPCGDFLAPPGEKVICHPNQYCADATFSDCATGCLSEYNCTENQICVKEPGEDVGSCEQL